MSLAVADRASRPSQPNNLTMIKYVGRNSTVAEHRMPFERTRQQVSGPCSSCGTVQAGLVLDPYTRLYVFDGKGGKDWDAAEQVAYRSVCGDELTQVEAVRDYLIELVAEVQSRFARMATSDDEICRESKITLAFRGMRVSGCRSLR
jgi:hypothetical protein